MIYNLYEKDIINILNDETIPKEKRKALDEYVESVKDVAEKAKSDVEKEMMFCSICNTFYRKKSFEKDYPLYICPKGHRFIDDYGC